MWHLKMKFNAQSSINEPRSTLSLTLPLIVGSLIGIGVLQFFLLRSNDPRAFDELALGPQTTTYWSKIESDPIHCGMEIDHFKSCVDAYVRNGRNRDVVLWLGNSQLHAINQFSKGDKSASFHLHTILRDRNRYLFTISIPNANLQEHLVLFEHAAQHLPVKTLVLPLVFDDTRETGLRENLQSLVLLPAIKERLAETSIGKKLIDQCAVSIVADEQQQAKDQTIQDQSEKYLNDKLASYSEVWANRPNLRGELFVSLYKFRNYILGINASSKRRVIRGSYVMNLEAMKAIIESARKANIEVLTYIAPLRNDVPIPYDNNEYAVFKQEVAAITRDAGGTLVNLEELVPNQNWGTKASTGLAGGAEVDFMHFQSEGHERLANAIDESLQTIWFNKY
jgi:hypothetical protein